VNCDLRDASLLALEKRDEKALFVGDLAAHVGRHLKHVQGAVGVARTDCETNAFKTKIAGLCVCVVTHPVAGCPWRSWPARQTLLSRCRPKHLTPKRQAVEFQRVRDGGGGGGGGAGGTGMGGGLW
jgi:hypothetical protein